MPTYKVPIQYESRQYNGRRKTERCEVVIEAKSAIQAAMRARDTAAGQIGRQKVSELSESFTVASVSVRFEDWDGAEVTVAGLRTGGGK